MTSTSLGLKLLHIWNWLRGKRIRMSDHQRGRVRIKTGRNSAERNSGAQWFLQRFEVSLGPPPLPRCCRGCLDDPVATLQAASFTGERLARAKLWYEGRHGPLRAGQDLQLVGVFDPAGKIPASPTMSYRPNEIFEIEHPWLSSRYRGPAFRTYLGTWYGRAELEQSDAMDFEIHWKVGSKSRHLPRWGASWR